MAKHANNTWFIKRDECPVCASDRYTTIYQSRYDEPPIRNYLFSFYSPQGMVEMEYLEGASYTLCLCEACGLIFQEYIPNEALMERLYEHWIDPEKVFRQEQKTNDLAYYSLYAQEIMQVLSYLGKCPYSITVLDYGMGWGRWAMMAKAFGCDVYGFELSQKRIEYAGANGIKILHWDDIPRARFDFINTNHVFEHIAEPSKTLQHLKKALKSDGILKISVPTANDIERRLKKMDWESEKNSRNSLNAVSPLEHINCYRRKSLTVLGRKAKMQEVRLPVTLQYKCSTHWSGKYRIARNLVQPIYQNVLKKLNHVYLRNSQESYSQ